MGFGYSTTVFGEAVFNTGMVGYPEALTDPSYSGQILALTYPLVGNYGVPDTSKKDKDGISEYLESDRIQTRGLVVHELSMTASHWNISLTLDEWLYNEKIPGISGIDTRELTKKLRINGVMMAALAVSEKEIDGNDSRLLQMERAIQSTIKTSSKSDRLFFIIYFQTPKLSTKNFNQSNPINCTEVFIKKLKSPIEFTC